MITLPKPIRACFYLLLILMSISSPALVHSEEHETAEQSGEQTAPKPEKKRSASSPVVAISELPLVQEWAKWMEYTGRKIDVSGEGISVINGSNKCWGVVVSEIIKDKSHVWRHFCISIFGGDVWVRSLQPDENEEFLYEPYEKWLTRCSPTNNSIGTC